MNEAMKAMKISSKVISVIMKIGYIATIVAMCACAAALIFMLVTGGETAVVTSGGTNITVADGASSPEAVAATCAVLLVMSAFLFVIFLLAHRMFRDISATGAPFKKEHVKTIKIVGILVAAMGIAGGVVDTVAASIAGMETLGIASDAPGILVGVIIFCFAYIIDYGCALQKRMDEADS